MFLRNKQLEEASQKIDELNINLNSSQETINYLKQQIQEFKDELQRTREQNKAHSNELLQNLIHVRSARERFEEELKDIKQIKKAIEVNLLNEVKTSLNDKFSEALHKLSTHIGNYNELSEKSSEIKHQLSSLQSEIKKLQSISSNLREKDFEMEKFAKQLLELDKEKLELMRKIDSLERLVSKQRKSLY